MATRRRCLVLVLALAPLGCSTTRIPAGPNPPVEPAPPSPVEAVIERVRRSSPEAELDRLARTIDGLEGELTRSGTIGIKAPDIWGQDRMTKFRAEYEQQLAGQQKDGFKSVMSAVIRRYEAVTSQIELDAVAPAPTAPANSPRNEAATTASSAKPALVAPAPPRDATEKEPIGVESTVVLDERSHFLNHLNQLRRINAGDELTDRPGYGLYLIRMPITLAPGREKGHGRGAIVTVEARPHLTRSLLPDTVRRVVLEGAKDQLRPIVLGALRGVPASSGGGAVPILSPAEVETLFGREGLAALRDTAKAELGADLEREPHRAEARVAEWLDRELAALYPVAAAVDAKVVPAAATGQAGVAVATPADLGELVARRRFRELAGLRGPLPADAQVVRTGADSLRIGAGAPGADPSERAEAMLAFALRLQAAAVDRMIREDVDKVAQDHARNHLDPGLVARLGGITFAGLDPSDDARRVFNEYVAAKWRVRVFAIEPVVEQQNVADFLSRRASRRADLAAAAGPGSGTAGAILSGGWQSDLDAAAVRLNPTMVGFGAGESTFGWRFYPRVQVPPQDNLLLRAERAVLGEILDSGERQIEPGQRECIAFVVMPTFVSAIEFTMIGGWFRHAVGRDGRPTEMEVSVALGKKLNHAKEELGHLLRRLDAEGPAPGMHPACAQVQILADRIRQLENLLPTQHYVSALPYGSEPVDAEIFESRGGHLAPTLTAWHGQPPDGTTDASLMIEGRGFSVHDTRVVVGNTPAEALPVSRTVLLVKIDARAQAMVAPDGRTYYDVHVATPNGVSNHLLIEVHQPAKVAVELVGWWDRCLPPRAAPH